MSQPLHLVSAWNPSYVADLGEITAGDVHRLVTEGTIAVVEELKHLRNSHYADRPLSLYGGMVDLPLIARLARAKLDRRK